MARRLRLALTACMLLAWSGCLEPVAEDGDGGTDSGAPISFDAGLDDAGLVDVDAGDADAGDVDAGDVDAGDVDAGDLDAGDLDAGDLDAGDLDAGASDAGWAAPCTDAAPCTITGYRFEVAPDCGSYCYYDEAHNLSVSGNALDNSGVGTFALGQLTDQVRGDPNWNVAQGYPWVGWLSRDGIVVLRLGQPRQLSELILGINNYGTGAVYAPSEIGVALSSNGGPFSAPIWFRRSDGSLPSMPLWTSGDVALPLAGAIADEVRITLVFSAAWTMLDEVSVR